MADEPAITKTRSRSGWSRRAIVSVRPSDKESTRPVTFAGSACVSTAYAYAKPKTTGTAGSFSRNCSVANCSATDPIAITMSMPKPPYFCRDSAQAAAAASDRKTVRSDTP